MRTRNVNRIARIGRGLRWVGRERDVSPMELQRWKRFLDGLPDLRSGKLEASRAALADDRYDDEAILDETAERVFIEISQP